VRALQADLEQGRRHPRDVKMDLARQVVAMFHGEREADRAQAEFRRVFQQGQAPEEMGVLTVAPGAALVDVIVGSGMASSKSQARRLMAQGGVRLDGEAIQDPSQTIALSKPVVLQVGKRGFVRLVPAN
jgi:tyrosyl-tRNA synthetase